MLGLKRYKEAVDVYAQVAPIGTRIVEADQIIRVGDAYFALEKYDDALHHYIASASNEPYCYFKQGQALFCLERYEESLAAYQQAQRLSESNPDPQFYHEQGRVHERLAQQAYEKEKQAQEQRKSTRESDIQKRPHLTHSQQIQPENTLI